MPGTNSHSEERLGWVVKVAQHTLRLRLDQELRGMGLTTAKYSALAALLRTEELSTADLARGGFVTPQTMGDIVKALERDGLLERNPHPVHRRVQLVRLTRRGRRVALQADELVKAVEDRMAAPLSKAERAATIDALQRCIGALRTEVTTVTELIPPPADS